MSLKVLVVDDSAVVRRLVSNLLGDVDGIEVVGTARNGRHALARVEELTPDVVIMDQEMPVMDGIEAVRELRRTHPMLPVVMFSTHTARGSRATMDALVAGAAGYVHKGAGDTGLKGIVTERLVPKILEVTGALTTLTSQLPQPEPVAVSQTAPRRSRKVHYRVLAIGCSTGGPNALADVIPALPGDLGVPVLIVQHMPPRFTRLLAERLDSRSALTVREAQAGDPVLPNTVLLAPGGYHMRLRQRGDEVVVTLDREAPVHSCRPAVDPLLEAVARIYGGDVLATILTGMGRDGAEGCRQLSELGATILAQDEATSVVWGMPRAVVQAGIADEVVPLGDIPGVIRRRLILSGASARRSA